MPPSNQNKDTFRKFYYSHGVELDYAGNQLLGTCPFCNKEGHFYVQPATGQYNCKRCGDEGNHYTFIQHLAESSAKSNSSCRELSVNRGIKEATLRHAGISRSITTGQWIIPSCNQDGKVVNLYQCHEVGRVGSGSRGTDTGTGQRNGPGSGNASPDRGGAGRNGNLGTGQLPKWIDVTAANQKIASIKYEVRSSPTPCQQQLYGIESITKHTKRIYLVEGHWDRLALLDVLSQLQPVDQADKLDDVDNYQDRLKRVIKQDHGNRLLKHWAVVAVPGATTLKKEWLEKFKDKDLVAIYDNDDAGGKGLAKLMKELPAAGVSSFQRMDWGESKYNDLRDLLYVMNPLQIFHFIHNSLVAQGVEQTKSTTSGDFDIAPEDCKTFSELVEVYDANLHFMEEHRQTLLLMLATVLSPFVAGPQIGLRVIGRPGSLKSTFSECLAQARNYVYPRSKFTGLVSGWHEVKAKDTLAAKIGGMCLLIKDADTLLQLTNLPQVESEIRDALADNIIRPEYRTGESFEIRSIFSIILCGTKTLRNMDDALLGSRFVDCVIHTDDSQDEEIVRRSMDSEFASLAKGMSGDQDLRRMDAVILALAPKTIGLLDHIRQRIEGGIELRPLTDNQKRRVRSMADMIAMCRAGVERGKNDDLKYRPEKELGSRLSKQLTRIATFVAIMLSKSPKIHITKEALDVVHKVVHDSCHGFRYEFIEIMANYRKRKQGMTYLELQNASGLSETKTRMEIADMKELGLVVTQTVSNSHGRGRGSHYLSLCPEAATVYRKALGR